MKRDPVSETLWFLVIQMDKVHKLSDSENSKHNLIVCIDTNWWAPTVQGTELRSHVCASRNYGCEITSLILKIYLLVKENNILRYENIF
jgi:hypothetical protein